MNGWSLVELIASPAEKQIQTIMAGVNFCASKHQDTSRLNRIIAMKNVY